MNLDQLITKIKETEESWGLLTGNGFNMACGVKTDYLSLCNALADSFSEELSTKEIAELKEEFKKYSYNFELWLSKKSKKIYMEKIALKAIQRQWLVEFVRACSLDFNQYRFSQKLNDFLDLFQYFFTLNVDPFFYRRCLARKEVDSLVDDSEAVGAKTAAATAPASSAAAQISAITQNVFIGAERESVREVDASHLSKRGKMVCGLIPDQEDKPKAINDGFTINGRLRKKETNSTEQNFFYLHGACHLKVISGDGNTKTISKLRSSDDHSLIRSILEEDPSNNSSIFAAESKEKLNSINLNGYLKSQYEAFQEIDCKNLVIYGASIADNDQHIWTAINANPNIKNVYIGFHEDSSAIKKQSDQLLSNKNVKFFKSEPFVND